MKSPTLHQYEALDQCYSYFNKKLFDNRLPPVLFTTQRKNRMLGYYSNKRWKSSDGTRCDEIAINPDYIAHVSYIKLMQTIVHEMCHCWQFNFGNPSRHGYHNTEWGNKMRSIGLIPSNTGKPGGKVIGQQMDDYPDPAGEFIKACIALLNEKKYPIHFVDIFGRPASLDIDKLHSIQDEQKLGSNEPVIQLVPEVERVFEQNKADAENQPIRQIPYPSKSKLKYTCSGCGINAWGKPELLLKCGNCNLLLDVQ